MVEIRRSLTCTKAAELADMPHRNFMLLNPAFNQRMTFRRRASTGLLVPVQSPPRHFSAALAQAALRLERVQFI